jgi:prepilin-type processing-associated H-X9-DG protein
VVNNKGYIPGGPTTSSRHLYQPLDNFSLNPLYSNTNCPLVIASWDWMVPIAKVMNVKFDEDFGQANRVARFQQLRALPAFRCPENNFLATPFGSVTTPTDVMVSYDVAGVFLMLNNPNHTQGGPVGAAMAYDTTNVPQGYAPKLTKVGNSAKKVYISDGARFSNSGQAPDTDLGYNSRGGGCMAHVDGPFASLSNTFDRSWAPGNGPKRGTQTDARLYSFRHGSKALGGPADAYRMNVAFFDGHVETMGDLQAGNPVMWLPKGSDYDASSFRMWEDCARMYGGNNRRTINE